MVSRKTHKSKALKLIIVGLVSFCLVFGTVFLILFLNKPKNEIAETEAVEAEIVEETVEPEITAINFQPVIDEWVNLAGGNKSILIYDLDRDELAGSYNTSEYYNTASLYKLFVVYEGYRRIESGVWDRNAKAGYTGRTILECLDLAIRESHSPCAETLWNKIGHAELDKIIRDDFGIVESNISGLSSHANDIFKIMKLFYEHPDITDEVLVTRMKDSFLNQPVTTYDWRRGLPSGIKTAEVYNKVGWDYNPSRGYWNIYHDAAIIKFPEIERNFIVVVMTNYIANQKIAELGSNIEQLVLSKY